MRHQEALEARVDKAPVDISTLKPSELIELALEDLEWVEAHPRYEVDMETWHEPVGKQCYVCLAGSVLARTCNAGANEMLSPCHCTDYGQPEAAADCLRALDSFRCGEIRYALQYITKQDHDEQFDDVEVTPYRDSPELFKSDMRSIINLLQEHDL